MSNADYSKIIPFIKFICTQHHQLVSVSIV